MERRLQTQVPFHFIPMALVVVVVVFIILDFVLCFGPGLCLLSGPHLSALSDFPEEL